jgi:septal ring-binding cell division protein DamX
MNKIMMLLVVCTGFAATMPMSANALDPQVVSQNLHGETNLLIAQYGRNQNRDRQFSVYYRNRGDRQWTLEGYHANRQDAQRAANRLERRGYRTYVQVSRRVNSGMGRG